MIELKTPAYAWDAGSTLRKETTGVVPDEHQDETQIGMRTPLNDHSPQRTRTPRGLVAHSLIFFIAITIVNASNYLFHIVMSRMLGPANYGALGGVLSGFVWISVCSFGVQVIVARFVSTEAPDTTSHRARGLLRSMLSRGVLWAGSLTIVTVILSGWISDYLRIPTILPVLALAAYVLPAVLGATVRGFLQGQLRFLWLASITAGTTVIRLLAGVVFVSMGFGVTGATTATVLAEILGLILGLVPLRRLFPLRLKAPVPKSFGRQILGAMLAIGGFWGFVNIDTFLVRHYFPGDDAGHYAAAAVAARAVLFFPVAVVTVAFPHFARSETQRGTRILSQSVLLVSGLGLAAAGFLAAFPSAIIGTLYGDRYLPGARPLAALAVCMALLGVVNVFVYYWLAVKSAGAWVVAPAIIVEVGAIVLWHSSPLQVAMIMAFLAAALVLFCLSFAGLDRQRHARGQVGTRPSDGADTLSDHTPL